jgi:hypothetical protein
MKRTRMFRDLSTVRSPGPRNDTVWPGHPAIHRFRFKGVSACVVAMAAMLLAAAPVLAAGGAMLPPATGGSTRGSGASSGTLTLPGLGTVPTGGGPSTSWGVIEDDPAALHAGYVKKAEQTYTDAVKAKAAGDLEAAVRLFLICAELGKARIDSPYPDKAGQELVAISEQGAKEVVVARALVAGDDPAAGLTELKRIARVYGGLPPAKQAGPLVRQLEADPAFQALLRVSRLAQDLKRAAALEAEADAPPPALEPAKTPGVLAATVSVKVPTEEERQAARIQRLLEAYELYGRIVQQGSDTDPAKQAAAARSRLEQDAGLMGRIKAASAERAARQYLSLAEGYAKAGLTDRAKEFCQKLLTECPGASQAARARELLATLK